MLHPHNKRRPVRYGAGAATALPKANNDMFQTDMISLPPIYRVRFAACSAWFVFMVENDAGVNAFLIETADQDPSKYYVCQLSKDDGEPLTRCFLATEFDTEIFRPRSTVSQQHCAI